MTKLMFSMILTVALKWQWLGRTYVTECVRGASYPSRWIPEALN
jgi:hypothetical protein